MTIIKAYSKEYIELVNTSLSNKEKKRIVNRVTEYLYFRIKFILLILIVVFISIGILCFSGLLKILFLILFPVLFIFIALEIINDGELFQYSPKEKVCFSIDVTNKVYKKRRLYYTNIAPEYFIGEYEFNDTIILNDKRKILVGDSSFLILDKNYKSKEIPFLDVVSISILTEDEKVLVKQRKEKKLYKDNVVLSIHTSLNDLNIVFKNNPNVGLVEINNIADTVLNKLNEVIK